MIFFVWVIDTYLTRDSASRLFLVFLIILTILSLNGLIKENGYRRRNGWMYLSTLGFIMYTILVNASPRNTSLTPCFVFPSKGISMKTSFVIKCEDGGIVDPDLPLLYKVCHFIRPISVIGRPNNFGYLIWFDLFCIFALNFCAPCFYNKFTIGVKPKYTSHHFSDCFLDFFLLILWFRYVICVINSQS